MFKINCILKVSPVSSKVLERVKLVVEPEALTEAPFNKSLEGKNATGELDTISGATVSSGPVVSGIHEAAKLVDTLK